MTTKNLEKDLYSFVKIIEKELLDKNKDQIQNESKDIFGSPIGFYSSTTEIISKGRKKAGEPFTGFETGDWFKGFYIQEVSGVLRFSSRDEKNQIILNSENWLSNEVFGLSDKNLKAVIQEKLLPFFLKNSREKLDL